MLTLSSITTHGLLFWGGLTVLTFPLSDQLHVSFVLGGLAFSVPLRHTHLSFFIPGKADAEQVCLMDKSFSTYLTN